MSNPFTAIVTGGSRGIGRGICLELARLGGRIVVNYASRRDAADDVVAQITALGAQAVAAQADVSQTDDRQSLVQAALDHFGGLDVLVNNAGVTSQGRKDLLEATEESWDRVLATNLKGPFFLSQLAAKEMIRQRPPGQSQPSQNQEGENNAGQRQAGKIINISSISAHTVSLNRADYCIAKSASGMMTRLFAQRLAEYGITVFEIAPGVIASDMTAAVKDKYDALIQEGAWPIRRWGQPEDVAKAVGAIVSDAFPFSTGCRIDVDGGFHIRTL